MSFWSFVLSLKYGWISLAVSEILGRMVFSPKPEPPPRNISYWYCIKAQNQLLYINHLVCKLKVRNWKASIFENTTSRHNDFTKFCRIIDNCIRNQSLKFQVDILKIGYFTERFIKCWAAKYNTVYEMRTKSRDITKFTGWCYVIH